jgi:hypothetical protein
MSLALLTSLILVSSASEKNVMIGILEDVPGKYYGEENVRAIRVVFQKYGNKWRSFPSDCRNLECLNTAVSAYPAETAWTIAFDGRNIGKLTSLVRKIEFYADIGLQEIVGATSVPTIGIRSQKYATWASQSLYRPLIAVSQPNFTDPEKWDPTQVPPELMAKMRNQFRQKYQKLCRMKRDETVEPFNYLDKDIALTAAYASNKGWIIANLNLEDGIDCKTEGPEVGIVSWFVIDPKYSVRFLDVKGWLIDAGDYDRDGKSELVFQTGGYNRGGYELYYSNFQKYATFEFSYH